MGGRLVWRERDKNEGEGELGRDKNEGEGELGMVIEEWQGENLSERKEERGSHCETRLRMRTHRGFITYINNAAWPVFLQPFVVSLF